MIDFVLKVCLISWFASFHLVGGRGGVVSSSQNPTEYNSPIYTDSRSPTYMKMGGKMYKVVAEHEQEYSNEEHEDYDDDEDQTVYDLQDKILAPLNLKLLKKVEEKKWLFDKLFNGWLAVLELKKKFLFQLWRMKQRKKKKDRSDEHYEYVIPYYTSPYKPHLHSKRYDSGHDEGNHSPGHYEDGQHNAYDDHDVYQNPDHFEDDDHSPYDEPDDADDYETHDHHDSDEQNQIYENSFLVTENFIEHKKSVASIYDDDINVGLSKSDENDEMFLLSVSKSVNEKSQKDLNAKSKGN